MKFVILLARIQKKFGPSTKKFARGFGVFVFRNVNSVYSSTILLDEFQDIHFSRERVAENN